MRDANHGKRASESCVGRRGPRARGFRKLSDVGTRTHHLPRCKRTHRVSPPLECHRCCSLSLSLSDSSLARKSLDLFSPSCREREFRTAPSSHSSKTKSQVRLKQSLSFVNTREEQVGAALRASKARRRLCGCSAKAVGAATIPAAEHIPRKHYRAMLRPRAPRKASHALPTDPGSLDPCLKPRDPPINHTPRKAKNAPAPGSAPLAGASWLQESRRFEAANLRFSRRKLP